MSIEHEIHDQWAGNATLEVLIPAARRFTGVAVGEAKLPYMVLNEQRARPHVRASQTRNVDRVELTFQIFTDDLDQSKAIAEAIHAQFDRQSFASDEGNVVSMRLAESTEHIHDDGVWQLAAKYTLIIERT